jgi:hypothetical protein
METQEKNKVDVELKKWVKGLLKDHVITLTFTKKDGTERVMKATLAEDWVPPTNGETTRKQNDESQAVWDTEAQGWRAFRWDSLKSVGITLE